MGKLMEALILLPLVTFSFIGTAEAETVWWQCQVPGFDKPIDFISHITHTAEGYKITESRTIGSNQVVDTSVTRGKYAISFIEELDTGAVNAVTIILSTGRAIYSSNKYVLDTDKIMASQVEAKCTELK